MYVDAPEFFDGIEGDDFFEEIVPIVVLLDGQCDENREESHGKHAFPLGGLVNQRVHSFINGCLTLKLSLSWKTVTCSSELEPVFLAPSVADSPEPSLAGEMGIVSSGTGDFGRPLVFGSADATKVAIAANMDIGEVCIPESTV